MSINPEKATIALLANIISQPLLCRLCTCSVFCMLFSKIYCLWSLLLLLLQLNAVVKVFGLTCIFLCFLMCYDCSWKLFQQVASSLSYVMPADIRQLLVCCLSAATELSPQCRRSAARRCCLQLLFFSAKQWPVFKLFTSWNTAITDAVGLHHIFIWTKSDWHGISL